MRKDALQALVDPPTVAGSDIKRINADQRGKFLVSSDRVIGVSLNGAHRAYPLQVMNCHEIVNDTLGGVPIAVTYNPLCDSVVVFERELDGETLVFGVSGLLYCGVNCWAARSRGRRPGPAARFGHDPRRSWLGRTGCNSIPRRPSWTATPR
jgi:hypothetical protein